ncbi:hypothetical protein M422DRAFT_249347 [Sphaerobolus stellatus SS14]|uniref:Fungal calcium binding protein domain-containing protein n=1 Tax=Sphaerobolus stellatus (strain SS14) TaxID=990650 RepID=A0A0C9UVH3_SPHS4|nr:hypothetical protein M422DRAFT_249347 [Sphaerobolus stellatus SS14]
MKFLFAFLCSVLVTASSTFTKRQEMPRCELPSCVGALAAAAPAIASCANAINDQNDPNASMFNRAAENVDCLIEAVESAIDIPKDCTPCVQALFPEGTVG